MSALSFKVGGFFKQLFSKGGKTPAPQPVAATAPTVVSAPRPAPVRAATPTAMRPAATMSGPSIEIPLSSVLNVLPPELKTRVRQESVTNANFNLPVALALPQLASGAVKISFGDIRRAFPATFTPGEQNDTVAVSLPLHEVLSRINPMLLTRRPTQKQIVVPEEISSPFSGRGTGLNLAVGNNNPQAPSASAVTQGAAPAPVTPVQRASTSAPAPTPAATPTPAIHLTTPLPGGTDLFQRKAAAVNNGTAKAPIFPRKPGMPATPPPAVAPAAEAAPAAPIAFRPSTPLPTTPVSAMAPCADDQQIFQRQTTPATPSAQSSRPKDVLSAPPVARSVQPAKSAAAPAPSAEGQTLLVPLSALSQTWPDAVRQEITLANLTDGRLAIPLETVEEALKRGRVVFNWKTIRSWIRPGTVSPASAQDAQELELPLAVLAPLFVARRKADAGQHQRVVVSEEIPNLFFGLPKADAPAAPAPADTNYYSWNDPAATPSRSNGNGNGHGPEFTAPLPASGGSGGTELMTKCAAPNEIVSRAAALHGVAGALIALPDGLMVASRIPPEFNGDTLAAFLPHIFSKVSQCTKELRMGELNNLNFTVGNVPWKIFRVNAIFFAAFGRVGEGLPTADLTALAAELDRKR